MIGAGWWAPAADAAAEDPFSMFQGWDSGQLAWLLLLVPVAVVVFFVGSKRFRAQLGASTLSPRGRDRFVAGSGGSRRDEQWRATVERLEARKATAIAEAESGPVRFEGQIVDASGNLGGAPGRECVWRNRAGAGPRTAVAAELLFVADGTGRCGVESLEVAHVRAPVDKTGAHYESVSLCIGDTVEIIGNFEREVIGEEEDPTRLIYGTLGADGRLDLRVLERPAPPEPEPEPEPEDGEAAAEPDHSDPPSDDASPSSHDDDAP